MAEGDGIHRETDDLRHAPLKEVVAGDDGVVVVRLTGELDLHNAPVLRETLFRCAEQGPERLVVDLADVTFLDSTVLGVLIETRTKLPNRRGFMLASPGLEARRALEVSGLDRHLSVHETVDDALAAGL